MSLISSPPNHDRSSNHAVRAADRIQVARIDASHSKDPRVVVDLSSVQRIDTKELGDLIRLHLDVKRDERILVLENLQDCVLQVMELTRLDRLFRIEKRHPG
jgi:anti-anti-sigma factor